ncbi:p12 [Artaxa digramma nucleopolyhedrovirus]|uniref:P12 n=1 Tax=Artaxa digramma nucleopolyhedrovirus TaxID=3070910 RepID=A0AAE6R7Y2_9ABAC|nr:p12 [Euproctis digramma nucleopolyhedrovirus]QHB21752.1 p12 [Artaxa digramma nucleopolyhedrovirus]
MSNNSLNDFIDTIEPGTTSVVGKTKKSKKRIDKSKRDARYDPAEEIYINPMDVINALNESNDVRTVAMVLQDESKNKVNSFKMLSGRSAVAKEILKDIEDDRDDLPMNTLRATNILRFLSNLHDNQF